MLSTKDLLHTERHTQTKSKLKKVFHGNGNNRKAGVAVLKPHKMDCKTKAILQETKKDLAILLLGIYPKKLKTLNKKDMYIHIFIAALFTVAKIWKLSIHQQMNEQVVHTYTMVYDPAIKNDILPSLNNMD